MVFTVKRVACVCVRAFLEVEGGGGVKSCCAEAVASCSTTTTAPTSRAAADHLSVTEKLGVTARSAARAAATCSQHTSTHLPPCVVLRQDVTYVRDGGQGSRERDGLMGVGRRDGRRRDRVDGMHTR